MNDQHGYAAGYDGYTTGAFDTTSFDADPLFGEMPGATGAYDAGQSGQWDNNQWDTTAWQPGGAHDAYATGTHEAYATGAHETLTTGAHTTATAYDTYGTVHTDAYDNGGYDTIGGYDTSAAWATNGYQPLVDIPAQAGPQPTEQWDAAAPWQPQGFEQPAGLEYGQAFETGAYDATAWNSDGSASAPTAPETEAIPAYDAYDTYDAYATTGFEPPLYAESAEPIEHSGQGADPGHGGHFAQTGHAEHPVHAEQPTGETEFSTAEFAGHAAPAGAGDDYGPQDEPGGPYAGAGPRGRSRRRSPAKRSALLTVAVPSVCALGVAGIAAASVAGGMGEETEQPKAQAAPDTSSVKPSAANSKLDTQLANLSADADDFADRASRTQERIDLRERQEAEKRRKAAEAARKEAMRPKFALPVKQQGISAGYGQAGINWMSVHSGIDFPVSYGTPVMAATDGTVRTQWNSAYGNMAIVTAPDGTETWYCHLSSTKIRSGSVKAGDTIAYSGNSGNSTGPHLHFEVRPGGGSAIDPMPWFSSHGLNPA